jgi:pilus assembly protein CpaB
MKSRSSEARVQEWAEQSGQIGQTAARARSGGAGWRALATRARTSPWWRLETALIVGAVVVGIGAAAMSEANRNAANRELMERFRVQTVVVAAKDLPVGSVIEADSVRYAEALASGVTANAVDADALPGVLGRTVGIELKAGDPLLLTGIDGASNANGVATKIPPGKRLVTLQIKDKVAEKGWIKPNDRVDVIATMELPGRGKTTFTLLQDVTVVSVGKASVWSAGQETDGTEIGFYASPDDVEFIGFAERHGEFSLSLRNPNDIAAKDKTRAQLGSDGMDMTKFLDHSSINKASGGGDLPVFVDGEKSAPSKKGR